MAEFSAFHEYREELERRIHLPTFPLAIKLLEKETDIPEGAERPLRDFGYRMTLCQGYALSRKESKLIAMFKEDMWCFEPIVGYGWVEPPQSFLKGHNRFPQDVKDLKAGETITGRNVRSIRPGNGLPPKYLKEILGRKVKKDVERGTPVDWDLVAGGI